MSANNPRCEIRTGSHYYCRVPSRGKRARWERFYLSAQPGGPAAYVGLANELQSLWLELATVIGSEGVDCC